MGKPRRPGSAAGAGPGDPEVHVAARSGDLRKLELLCEADPLAINSRDRHSRTPLHLAAWSGQTEVARFLCNHKADVGAAAMDDTAAIHFASQKGHLEVVRTLVASGASVKAANRKGMTPLHFAAQNGHMELVKYLVKKGASLSAKTKGGQSALHVAENDDVRAFLQECEQPSKKGGELSSTRKEDTVSGPSQKNGNSDELEDGEVSVKREGEDIPAPEPKRAKVSLDHLLSDGDKDGDE